MSNTTLTSGSHCVYSLNYHLAQSVLLGQSWYLDQILLLDLGRRCAVLCAEAVHPEPVTTWLNKIRRGSAFTPTQASLWMGYFAQIDRERNSSSALPNRSV
jgi:hypothetical protein